jgi:hypothetical protein
MNLLSEKREEEKEKPTKTNTNSRAQKRLGENKNSTALMAGRKLPPLVHTMEEQNTP